MLRCGFDVRICAGRRQVEVAVAGAFEIQSVEHVSCCEIAIDALSVDSAMYDVPHILRYTGSMLDLLSDACGARYGSIVSDELLRDEGLRVRVVHRLGQLRRVASAVCVGDAVAQVLDVRLQGAARHVLQYEAVALAVLLEHRDERQIDEHRDERRIDRCGGCGRGSSGGCFCDSGAWSDCWRCCWCGGY